jgi:hypothetical protein
VNFDGNEPHCTLPYTGTRYTLIYFTHQSYSKLGGVQRENIAAGEPISSKGGSQVGMGVHSICTPPCLFHS